MEEGNELARENLTSPRSTERYRGHFHAGVARSEPSRGPDPLRLGCLQHEGDWLQRPQRTWRVQDGHQAGEWPLVPLHGPSLGAWVDHRGCDRRGEPQSAEIYPG